jgi:hypothetical protein
MPELFSYKTVDMQQFQIERHNHVEAKSAPVAKKDARLHILVWIFAREESTSILNGMATYSTVISVPYKNVNDNI